MNQPPQNQAAAAAQLRVLRPEQMRNITYLTPEEKQRYEDGLRQLWAKMESNGPETPEHQSAKQKLIEFSRMVLNKVKTLHARNQANAQTQPGQPSGQTQPAQDRQPQPAIAATTPTTATGTAGPKPPMPTNRPQVPAAGNNAGNAGPSATNNPGAPGGQTAVPKHIMEHINKLPWSLLSPPPQTPQEQTAKWHNDMKQRYVKALVQMETIKGRLGRLDAMMKERMEKNPPTAEEMRKFQEQKLPDTKLYTEGEKFARYVRGLMQAAQQAAQQASQNAGAQGQGNGQQQVRPQTMQTQNTGATASSHPMQAMTASVNAAMDAAKNQQLAAANRAGSAGQPQLPQTPATPATPVATSAPQQPSHPAPAPQPQPQPQVKVEPGNHLQHPPPVNTTLAAASTANIPSAGTPTQASARVQTPQSSTQQPPGSVRPLTHSMAVNRANSSANVTGQPNTATSGITTTPGSNSLMNNASQQPGHSHAHPQPSTSALTSRMPIPKTLPEKATAVPTAVTLGGGNTAGRPTFGGGNGAGVNNQPVITKMNAPQFDAEGDHVLSKKKLDELVRQVCGGGTPGVDGNYLTPDVEESVLNVADNFVDSILHSACRLAKERGSKVLEIRDIQLVLERVYNIRIPGYTSDELRTVRKVQPSPNWIAKMSAIQAAKVTSGKDDK
ncbi:transcription initiation factor TFIID subunit A-domain-containing protein [Biscogniauxia marginata]|nr:transcription initiation factor TFIID subunit A-domain-containing protein [Biscogniauxia marginata]